MGFGEIIEDFWRFLRNIEDIGAHFVASKATTASKQPQSSNLASDLKSVTPITYISMYILLAWYFIALVRPIGPFASRFLTCYSISCPITIV